MIGARFDPAVHNRRRLEEFRGSSPEETVAGHELGVDRSEPKTLDQRLAVDREVLGGPEVSGRLLDLAMAMAGRREELEDLKGDGVPELRRRLG